MLLREDEAHEASDAATRAALAKAFLDRLKFFQSLRFEGADETEKAAWYQSNGLAETQWRIALQILMDESDPIKAIEKAEAISKLSALAGEEE